MDLLLDTNVLIDHFGNRGSFASDAHKVFGLGLFGDATLWVTSNALTDVFYLLKKAVGSHQVQAALLAARPCLHVCSVGQDDVFETLARDWPDMEDCLVSVCAEKVNARYIVTRDEKDFTRSKVQAIHPHELLARYEQRGVSFDFVDF